VAGYDENGPHLYQLDPSGAYYGRIILSFFVFSRGFCKNGRLLPLGKI